MLVLGRRVNEAIVIEPAGIEIIVVGVRDGQVRLGFRAPPTQTVLREELAHLNLRHKRGQGIKSDIKREDPRDYLGGKPPRRSVDD